MRFYQKEIRLQAKSRGFHLITQEIEQNLEALRNIKVGQLQVFIKHTSASLTINENADPTVRQDFESHMNKMVPENAPYYIHTYEGPDDMPAHLKTLITNTNLTISVVSSKLLLGVWQGIYLCEWRKYGQTRSIIVHLLGE